MLSVSVAAWPRKVESALSAATAVKNSRAVTTAGTAMYAAPVANFRSVPIEETTEAAPVAKFKVAPIEETADAAPVAKFKVVRIVETADVAASELWSIDAFQGGGTPARVYESSK
jgi:hypothetical protein